MSVNIKCPATTDGEHGIEWMDVPPMTWVGGSDFGGQDAPAMQRGFCWECDERFTRVSALDAAREV